MHGFFGRRGDRRMTDIFQGSRSNEGSSIGKEDLRQVQGHPPPWGGACDLRKHQAQTAPGITLTLHVPAGIGRVSRRKACEEPDSCRSSPQNAVLKHLAGLTALKR